MALFGRSKKGVVPASPTAPATPAATATAATAAAAAATEATAATHATDAPAAPKFDPTRYGLVPDSEVKLDMALGDAELAEALRAAHMGDWQPAAAVTASTVGDWDRRFLHVSVLADSASTTDYWLQSWRQAEPDSPHAAVVLAAALHNQASVVRGSQSASQTSREQFEGFHRLSRDTARAAQRAIELAPEDPTPWVTRISAAKGQQLPHEEFLEIWEGLVARAPLHRRGHTTAHQYWLKKWFGSDELAEKFVTEETGRAPGSIMAFELRLHFAVERRLSLGVPSKDYYRTGGGRQILDAALADYWTGTVPEGDGLAVVDGNLLAWALTLTGRYDEACSVWEKLGGRICAGYPWIYYNDSVGTFRSLRREAFQKSSREPNA